MDLATWRKERDTYLKQLEKLTKETSEAGNVAFHLTEICSEVAMLHEIRERLLTAESEREFQKQLDAFYATVCVHWQYHIKHLDQLRASLAAAQ